MPDRHSRVRRTPPPAQRTPRRCRRCDPEARRCCRRARPTPGIVVAGVGSGKGSPPRRTARDPRRRHRVRSSPSSGDDRRRWRRRAGFPRARCRTPRASSRTRHRCRSLPRRPGDSRSAQVPPSPRATPVHAAAGGTRVRLRRRARTPTSTPRYCPRTRARQFAPLHRSTEPHSSFSMPLCV